MPLENDNPQESANNIIGDIDILGYSLENAFLYKPLTFPNPRGNSHRYETILWSQLLRTSEHVPPVQPKPANECAWLTHVSSGKYVVHGRNIDPAMRQWVHKWRRNVRSMDLTPPHMQWTVSGCPVIVETISYKKHPFDIIWSWSLGPQIQAYIPFGDQRTSFSHCPSSSNFSYSYTTWWFCTKH